MRRCLCFAGKVTSVTLTLTLTEAAARPSELCSTAACPTGGARPHHLPGSLPPSQCGLSHCTHTQSCSAFSGLLVAGPCTCPGALGLAFHSTLKLPTRPSFTSPASVCLISVPR